MGNSNSIEDINSHLNHPYSDSEIKQVAAESPSERARRARKARQKRKDSLTKALAPPDIIDKSKYLSTNIVPPDRDSPYNIYEGDKYYHYINPPAPLGTEIRYYPMWLFHSSFLVQDGWSIWDISVNKWKKYLYVYNPFGQNWDEIFFYINPEDKPEWDIYKKPKRREPIVAPMPKEEKLQGIKSRSLPQRDNVIQRTQASSVPNRDNVIKRTGRILR